LALLASSANALKVEVCSDSLNDFGIEDLQLPDVVVAGQKIELKVSHEANKYINKGSFKVEIDVEGVKLAAETYELCSVGSCDLAPRQEGLSSMHFQLPESIPAGLHTTIKIVVNDHNGALLSCVEAEGVKIHAKEKKDSMLRVSAGPLSLALHELEFMFERWAHEFGVKIEGNEMVHRMKVFADNLEAIAKHNLKRAEAGFTLGLNQFAHLTHEEFASTHLGYSGGESTITANRSFFELDVATGGLSGLPDEVDWVKEGAVTPVKNQGSCGSCWAFSTTGALEGAYFLKTGKLVSFSEQELVSCDKVDQGCNGGLMDNADRFIQTLGGLCTEDDYPYVSGTGHKASCNRNCEVVEGSSPKQIVDVAHNRESLEEAVAKQPVSVAIQADQLAFQFYRRGVLTGNCGHQLDHGVLVVGYGTLKGKTYWKVKNSWGPSYGLGGYILIQRGKPVRGGECGILLSASYPVL